MSSSIYFCGEVVADLFQPKGSGSSLDVVLGGSHFNAALGAARAVDRGNEALEIGFVGPISTDMLGERFYRSLTDHKINVVGVSRVEGNTTLALVFQRPGEENAFTFYSRGTTLDEASIPASALALGQKDSSRVFWFGSISTVIDPARFAWLDYARKRRDDSLIVYDLNTRPSIAKDAAHHRDIILEWARVAHVVKASDADIAWSYPGKNMKEVADLWLDAGASMVVFTKGMHGSEGYTRTTTAQATTLDLVAENTVGAGDNFNAGLAIALSKQQKTTSQALTSTTQQELESILRYANDTAAYHLVSIGAQPRNHTL